MGSAGGARRDRSSLSLAPGATIGFVLNGLDPAGDCEVYYEDCGITQIPSAK